MGKGIEVRDMRKVIVTENFDQNNRMFLKGETYEVMYESEDRYHLLIKKGKSWEISKYCGLPNSIIKKYNGKQGWSVDYDKPVKLIDDVCGDCSSSCRNSKSKCGLYQE